MNRTSRSASVHTAQGRSGRVRRPVPATLAATAVIALGASPATADDGDGGLRLSPVQIFGTPEAVQEHPGAVTVVDEREVDQRGTTRSIDFLEAAPGITLQTEDALGRRTSIGIRGLDPRRSRKAHLMEDGAPIQLGPYGDPTTHYSPSPHLIREVEVIKGSGSILYGPQTIGGAVNFLTVDPPEAESQWMLRGGAGSEGYREGHLSWGGTTGDSAHRFDYVRQETDGPQDSTGQKVRDLMYKNRTRVAPDHELSFKFTATDEEQDGGEAGLNRDQYREDPRQNPYPDDVFEVERYAVQMTHDWDLAPDVQLTTNLYGNLIDRTAWRQAGSSTTGFDDFDNCPDGATSADECGFRIRPRSYRTYGVEPRLSVGHELFGDYNRFVGGFRLQREVGERETFKSRPESPEFKTCITEDGGFDCRQRNWESESAAVFAQNKTYIGDWSVTPGIRVEYWRFDERRDRVRADNGDPAFDDPAFTSNSYTEVLPGIGAAWEGLDSVTLFGGVHRGLSPAPLSGVDQQEVADPEFSWNYEVGARARGVPGVQAEGTFFYVDYEDLIASDQDPTEADTFNAGDARMFGVELAGRLDSQLLLGTERNYYLTGSVTWLDTEFRNTVSQDPADPDPSDVLKGNEFPYAPEWSTYLAVGMEHNRFDGRVGVRYVDEVFADNLNTTEESADGQQGTIPSYYLVEAQARYQITPDLKAFLVGRNLADREYFTNRQGGIQPEMPRQVFAGLEATF